jgi:hypothetical protein
MSLRLRDDDAELLEWLRARTGLGRLTPVPARATSKPQVQWLVQTQADCRVLADLLTQFPLRGHRRAEFGLWRSAVELWHSPVTHKIVVARRLREQLAARRSFSPPEAGTIAPAPSDETALRGYLQGLVAAEGSFELRHGCTGLAIHMRQDSRPLLAMLAAALGIGCLRDHPESGSSRPSSTWRVGRLDEVAVLAGWLDPQQMRGRKAAELQIWLRAIAERQAARESGRRARLDGLIAEFRAVRAYRPGRLSAISSRADNRRDEAVEVLRDWAAHEPELLSCTRYAAARRANWPSRNAITRRFGSWDAALRAAGLEDRLPRAKPYRVGGEAVRKAHDEAQRERVLATLRYGVTIHGSLPTAMQFFRWRIVGAPATPTQATVYRLFPGGWSAVLAAYEASADQPSRSRVARGSFSTTRS